MEIMQFKAEQGAWLHSVIEEVIELAQTEKKKKGKKK